MSFKFIKQVFSFPPTNYWHMLYALDIYTKSYLCSHRLKMNLRITLILLSTLCMICAGQGVRPMGDETYSTVLKVLKGEFDVPVADRMKTQHWVWRNRDKYSLSDDGKSVLCNGRVVVKKSDIPALAKRGFDATKGSNARKVNIRLREKYSGLSEKTVQQAFDSSRQCQLLRAKFPNKPPLKPITAKHVQTRHQTDLVDMTGWRVTHGRPIYKYILTVPDVFSRYVWLKPLKGKSSRVIAQHLADIYMEDTARHIRRPYHTAKSLWTVQCSGASNFNSWSRCHNSHSTF